MQASSSLHGGFNLHPLAKNAENSLSKKLPRRLRDGREREREREVEIGRMRDKSERDGKHGRRRRWCGGDAGGKGGAG